ncbi:MAG: SAM-dependent methyltransferase [Alkalinema sp. CACIAM 70d]|nr:MAG: SAM-dependent methyltransferase [Alkalinema sp. CACIAM 70d]
MTLTANNSLSEADLEKLRQHFNQAPYPRVPLESIPTEPYVLYTHSLITANYRRSQKVVSSEGKLILDAGCGTGYKSFALAKANPGAKVIGVDLSEDSVELAKQRLNFHNVAESEFYAMPLEQLPELGLQFDYINCDEVLYLIPDPMAGLAALRKVLKPDGILRINFHSALQRRTYLRAQNFFNLLGLMEGPPTEQDIEIVRSTMRCLNGNVHLKNFGWGPNFEKDDETILANYLLKGDKGWTIREFFQALQDHDLEFISMVNWWQWNLVNLFQDVDELPIEIAMGIADKSVEEQLHLFELLHPVHRLLDLYCGVSGTQPEFVSPSEWSDTQWMQATLSLHPVLNTNAFRENLVDCIQSMRSFPIRDHLPINDQPIMIDSLMATCLLPLVAGSTSMEQVIQYWLKIRPVNPVTGSATSQQESLELVKQLFCHLETLGYVLTEQP